MEVIVLRDVNAVSERIAEIVLAQVKRKSNSVIGLASGETMLPVYKILVREFRKGAVSFSKVRTFNLDEYVGLGKGDSESMKYYMWKNLFDKTDFEEKNIGLLDGLASDLKSECARFEREIKKSGGIDLQLLGLGTNGHIAYNEPGSSFTSRTRKIQLSEETRRSKAAHFKSLKKVPRFALTMGVGTILDSRKIILAATGKHKSDAVCKIVRGKVSRDVPASVLRKHIDAEILLDQLAASSIKKFI